MKNLAIIIVCYNSKEFLPACLKTLQRAMTQIDATAWVIDNGGTDGTADFVRAEYPWCETIFSDRNGGYSYGNNLGLKAAGFPVAPRYRYAMLLNPDTEMPPDALREMIAYMDANPDIGVLGPKLVLENGQLDKACKRGAPTPLTSMYHFVGLEKLFPRSPRFGRYNMSFVDEDEIADIDSTVGACQIMRGEVLMRTGLMDEGFFMYGEDLDLNLRIQAAGYRVVYYPRVVVKHLKGTSTRKAPEKMTRAFYEAMKIFHRKHFADDYSRVFNWTVYRVIDLICKIKLLRIRMRAPDKRVVGSAPGSLNSIQ